MKLHLETTTKPDSSRDSLKKIESFLRNESPNFATFSGDPSLKYIPVNMETFVFFPDKNTVGVPYAWFEKEKFQKNQFLWAVYHELSHFIDMRENPTAFLENFEKMKKKAEKMKDWMLDELKKQGVEKKLNEDKIKLFFYQQIHRLYNILDDIYVNNLVEQRAPMYQSTEEGKESVRRLYQEVGYDVSDHRNSMLSHQFTNVLMQKEMLGEMGKVSPEVEEVLKKKILGQDIFSLIEARLKPKVGKLRNPEDRYRFIETFIEPIFFALLKKDILSSLDQIIENIENTKENSDKENGENQEGQESGEGQDQESEGNENQEGQDQEGEGDENKEGQDQESEGNENQEGQDQEGEGDENKEGQDQEGEGDESQEGQESGEGQDQEGEGDESQEGQNQESEGKEGDEASKKSGEEKARDGEKKSRESQGCKKIEEAKKSYTPPSFSEEDVQKIIDYFKEKERYASLSPDERAEEDRLKKQEDFDREHHVSSEARRIFNESVSSVTKARIEMMYFWKNLVGKGVSYERKKTGRQKKGNINPKDLIREYPNVVDGVFKGENINKLPIHERFTTVREETEIPEEIRVRILADISGSMDDVKLNALQKSIALLLLSLKDFNITLKRNGSNLRALSEVYVFESSYEKPKHFPKKKDDVFKPEEEAQIIETFSYLNQGLGGTNMSAPLTEIVGQVDKEEEKKILEGKIRDIVFVITDGSPNNVLETKKKVDALIAKGLIPIGIQIGDVSSGERGHFEFIFNEGRKEKLGFFIGSDLNKLPGMLMSLLKKKIGKVKL